MPTQADVLIALPVYNAEFDLRTHASELLDFLKSSELGWSWRVVIADNASTDSTEEIGRQLAEKYEEIIYLRIPRKGRGYALRTAWSTQGAEFGSKVLAYMDIDLSTPPEYIKDLIDPLVAGEADISLGSRLAKGAQAIDRRLFREITSRGYNFLLQFFMGAEFKDAQCGFKAVRADVFRELEPQILNDNWFFDTELLLKGQYSGRKLREVPVIWHDDPNSSVHVGATIREDLLGMKRLWLQHRPRSLFLKIFSFLLVGGLTTVASSAMFYGLRLAGVNSFLANTICLVVMTFVNIYLNRRFTFGHKRFLWRSESVALVASFIIYWGTTTGGLLLAQNEHWSGTPWADTVLVFILSLVGTVLKYILFHILFRERKVS